MEVNDRESNTNVVKLSRLDFSIENLHPEAYGWKVAAENKMEMVLDQLYIEAESKFVEKLLTVMSYIHQEESE